MARWQISISLEGRDTGTPLYVRIARAVTDDIRRGRLRPGAALPGQRILAHTLDVNRETVAAAYAELKAQGWIVVRRAHGAFVTESLPEIDRRRPTSHRRRTAATPGFSFEPSARIPTTRAPHGVLNLGGSSPDLREFPATELARAFRRQLRSSGRTILGYSDPHGHAGLRDGVASMLSTRRGLAVRADEVLVTRGSQMALDLLARALVRRGDVIAVEEFGYRPAWAAFEGAGARLARIPLDGDGMDIGALEALLRTQRIRAVYVMPHHQYPTTATLSPARRMALLDAARRHRFAVIEDDYDHEFHYEGRPIHPLASVDREGLVVYVGTLSKTLAPALRIGYVAAPRPIVDALAVLRESVDGQGDTPIEAAVATLLTEGAVQRHTWRMQRLARVRRDAFASAAKEHLGERLAFRVPAGGMAVWARVQPGLDVEAWARRCLAKGVFLRTGKDFTHDLRPIPYLRLTFASLREAEADEALRRMAACL